MKRVLVALMMIGALMFLAAPATADWFPGDDHKMHHPQLPDPQGWDVDFIWPNVVADDWKCSQTGPVSDVHLWFSVERDGPGVPPEQILGALQSIHLSIHKDIPVDESTTGYSMPGELLWERDITQVIVPLIPAGQGDQGWADPLGGIWRRPDHQFFFQANMIEIDRPFIQQEGEIYWLDVSVKMAAGYDGPRIGWKTTKDVWNDDAVFLLDDATGAPAWQELWEYGETGGRSLDMAFVITPEPGTVAMLLGAGLMGLLAYARRRRRR